MRKTYSVDEARAALKFCDPQVKRDEWFRILAAAKAADLTFDDVLLWSSTASNFKGERDVQSAWRSLKNDGGITVGTLFHFAQLGGWRANSASVRPQQERIAPTHASCRVHVDRPLRWHAKDVWAKAIPATDAHPYIIRKQGIAGGLRVCNQHLQICGDDMYGALVVPVTNLSGELISLQFIPGEGDKMNLPGHKMCGLYVVGELKPDVIAYVCEGIGQAWACWKATGRAAVVAFGWGRVKETIEEIRAKFSGLRVVLVPDAGKETEAAAIAAKVDCNWINMPPSSPKNFDVNDYAAENDHQALEILLDAVNSPHQGETNQGAEEAKPLYVRPANKHIDARDGTHDTHPLTESGNAQRIADEWRGRLHYSLEQKKWLVWDEGRWVMVDEGHVKGIAAKLPDKIYAELSRHHPDAEYFASWARKSQSAKTIASAVSLLSDMRDVRIHVKQLNADPMICGLDDGRKILDLRSGLVRASVPADFITKSLCVTDLGDATKAVRWLRFMDEVTCGDIELMRWLHRFLGYCLTGTNTEQFFVFAFGHGANGKSVLTEVMLALMGDYATSIQPATLCDEKRSGSGPSPDLARLNGIRLAVAAEAEEGSRFAESLMKSLVSGDTIPVRELHCAPFEMKPVLKLILTGNHKPYISGTDRGIWRRVRLVPFEASFEGRADPDLTTKLRLESPHILAWLVQGCQDWEKISLRETPKKISESTEEYRAETDVIGNWLGERCDISPEAVTPSADLYSDFKEWCMRNGFNKIQTAIAFSKKLTEYRIGGWNIDTTKRGNTRCRTGVSLRGKY
ncbi:MAG: phage/plasmid primase, P4 family [Leptothrix sp. (in: b-proteobacteria)]